MPCCKQDSLCSHSFGNILFEAIRHAVKALAEIPEKIKLLPPSIADSISALKTEILNEKTISLDVEEALIALSISAATNPAAQLAMEKLKDLWGCEVHMTHIPTPGDEARACGGWGST